MPRRHPSRLTGSAKRAEAATSRICPSRRFRAAVAASTASKLWSDELVVELAQLTGYRTDVMADWVRGVNRLRSLLGSIFPGLDAASDYSNRTPLILVAHLCTPAEIRAAGSTGVTAYLGDNGG